jgi:hypothetical protein
VSQLRVGFTHTQYSADPSGNRRAVARAWQLMQAIPGTYQAQAIMGWGVGNPEPSPGDFEWGSLDARMALIRHMDGTPIITLCCAPDWMKGGRPGHTNWNALTEAPTPKHFHDFADLAAAVATRYPYVRYFQVWNELKGFWNERLNRWDYEGYTELYNDVYDAIKRVRPDAMVGGPYIALDSGGAGIQSNPSPVHGRWGRFDERDLDVVTYWLSHKHGADFIALQAANGSGRDGRSDGFKGCQEFVAATEWLRSLGPASEPGATTLPLVWSEWYAYPGSKDYSLAKANAVMASCLITTLESGSSAALVWGGQGDRRGYSFPEGLWTNSALTGGGKPTPYYFTEKALSDYFAPGTTIYATSVSGRGVTALASASHILIVNQTPARKLVSVAGRTVRLARYGVTVVDY